MTVDADLLDLADSVLDTAESDGAGLDAALWQRLTGTGLDRLAAGGGGELTDLAAVLTAAGTHAARVPLAETDLAARLATAAGLAVPDGPLAVTTGEPGSGTLPRVAWGRYAAAVVVLGAESVTVLDPSGFTVAEGSNLAEEPRDTLTVHARDAARAPAPGRAAAELRLRAALYRALLLAGAARGALAASVHHAGEREQFGRPIGRFQAVQQELALAAGEVAAGSAAAGAAAGIAAEQGFAAPPTELAVAAAKVRTGQAATAVARIAHQVHGAIGFTREHDLRLTTTRLWAWRDEDGSETFWAHRLGEIVAAAGPDGLWPLLTG